MTSAPSPYVLLGAVAVGERRSRQVLSVGVRAASIATWPAARGWRSPLAAPLRSRVNRAADGLAREGRDVAESARTQARVAGRRLGEQIVASGLADEAIERALSSGAFDNVIAVVVDHPATETAVAAALDSPGLERLIAHVMDSRMVDEVVTQLLESDQMKLILDHVTRALAHQTAGLAGDVAVGVRARTVTADDAAERLARALLRRPRRAQSP